MSHQDIIELIKEQLIRDLRKEVVYYKALTEQHKVISCAKGSISSTQEEKRLIDYVMTLPDGYNKEHNNVLHEIEEIVDHKIEKWKDQEKHMDKVEKYERVMF
jgi:hypothetical protein